MVRLLTSVLLLQVTFTQREQADLHGQDSDLPTATPITQQTGCQENNTPGGAITSGWDVSSSDRRCGNFLEQQLKKNLSKLQVYASKLLFL